MSVVQSWAGTEETRCVVTALLSDTQGNVVKRGERLLALGADDTQDDPSDVPSHEREPEEGTACRGAGSAASFHGY